MNTSADRARLLIKKIGPKKVSLHGGDYERWKSVSKGAIRVSTEEIDVLVKIYPHYALWLASGNTAPEIGQTSPEYDDANSNLPSQNAG
ncbi:TPA: DNA-binding protein [Pseudomonas aeruginosa]|nr:DNA-binding protein [Pseudomonas aeruginosa]HBP5995062.1 DNA-binding protein [Pseudomonas aeruginosa]